MRNIVGRILLNSIAAISSAIIVSGCGYSSGIIDPRPGPDWKPFLAPSQISQIQQSFPLFLPELLAPGTDPCSSQITPFVASPNEFFGAPTPEAPKITPLGIKVWASGYDAQSMTAYLPADVSFFDCAGNPALVHLPTVSWAPLDLIEQKLGQPPVPGAPLSVIDLREGRVSLSEIDQMFTFVKQQVNIALPLSIDEKPQSCEIVIEPSIFYVGGFGYAGGLTIPLDDGQYRIYVMMYYISKSSTPGQFIVANWKKYLLFEEMNCILAAGGNGSISF